MILVFQFPTPIPGNLARELRVERNGKLEQYPHPPDATQSQEITFTEDEVKVGLVEVRKDGSRSEPTEHTFDLSVDIDKPKPGEFGILSAMES